MFAPLSLEIEIPDWRHSGIEIELVSLQLQSKLQFSVGLSSSLSFSLSSSTSLAKGLCLQWRTSLEPKPFWVGMGSQVPMKSVPKPTETVSWA
ncbi:hypothetical protein ACLKA6_010937 [Drosophila palustris]